ncbi:MAG: YciK family oxidoreductase [Marinomonas sp.]|uniref:YciK family oxidoreductase n=1 Tax=Marinomonas communis TaxID=28254 RepID=UPI001001244C|nr:YciK family oxidoreductase [Marinomonas communis]MCC4275106.1 YciK family oxidoreductase [Marinomonas communis]MEC8080112.1 YciK family oxidoreductase [Pseudomonadota bacterium]RUM54165.1 MAG: YciK family oxidoreductase [Marinomonas sp.]RUM54187.1 MAG: YciK family oxidoreductase [Marinomonas sp.]
MLDYQAPNDLLKEKVILVTGAGDGIGKQAALSYAACGATVILLGRTTKKLEAVYDQIESLGYPQAAIVPLNLDTAAEHDYIELANTIETEFGRLDGILHNASILGDRTPLANFEPSTFEQVMRVNVTAAFLLNQALIPLLQKAPKASIIFTTSSVGRKAKAYWGAYAVSKFATEAMMQLLADELENISNIRVNAINPGGTRTNMRAHAYPAEDPNTLKTPLDIMPLYLYLMGNDSADVNGQSLDAQPK